MQTSPPSPLPTIRGPSADRGGRAVAALVVVALLLSPALAQEASIFYVYDEIGRLTAVVDQQGDAATYTYDAVGNVLRIERFDASGAVAITLVAPTAGDPEPPSRSSVADSVRWPARTR